MSEKVKEVDVRPDVTALLNEVLAEVPEENHAGIREVFDLWQASRSLVPQRAAVEVIVAGEPHPMETGDGETFRELRERALRETNHDSQPYAPAEEWELRNSIGALILDLNKPARSLADAGWPRLWLNPPAGSGS